MTKKELELFDKTWTELRLYILAACNSFSYSFRDITTDDLVQECAVKLIDLIRAKIKPDNLSSVFKASIYNMLKDKHRLRKRHVELMEINMHKFAAIEPANFTFLDLHFYTAQIRKLLKTDAEKAMFDCMLNPDARLLFVVLQDDKNEVKIEKKHLAKRFGVSPATISRFVAHLNRLAEEIFRKTT